MPLHCVYRRTDLAGRQVTADPCGPSVVSGAIAALCSERVPGMRLGNYPGQRRRLARWIVRAVVNRRKDARIGAVIGGGAASIYEASHTAGATERGRGRHLPAPLFLQRAPSQVIFTPPPPGAGAGAIA